MLPDRVGSERSGDGRGDVEIDDEAVHRGKLRPASDDVALKPGSTMLVQVCRRASGVLAMYCQRKSDGAGSSRVFRCERARTCVKPPPGSSVPSSSGSGSENTLAKVALVVRRRVAARCLERELPCHVLAPRCGQGRARHPVQARRTPHRSRPTTTPARANATSPGEPCRRIRMTRLVRSYGGAVCATARLPQRSLSSATTTAGQPIFLDGTDATRGRVRGRTSRRVPRTISSSRIVP